MVVGRIKLFHAEQDGSDNCPAFKGSVEYTDGTKDGVTLWKNEHPRVTGGEYFTGQVYTIEKEEKG